MSNKSDFPALRKAIRQIISEQLVGVYLSGIRRSNLDDLKKYWPIFYDRLYEEYADVLSSCIVAIRKQDQIKPAIPYVLLPDERMTVMVWNPDKEAIDYSANEDVARAIERLK